MRRKNILFLCIILSGAVGIPSAISYRGYLSIRSAKQSTSVQSSSVNTSSSTAISTKPETTKATDSQKLRPLNYYTSTINEENYYGFFNLEEFLGDLGMSWQIGDVYSYNEHTTVGDIEHQMRDIIATTKDGTNKITFHTISRDDILIVTSCTLWDEATEKSINSATDVIFLSNIDGEKVWLGDDLITDLFDLLEASM